MASNDPPESWEALWTEDSPTHQATADMRVFAALEASLGIGFAKAATKERMEEKRSEEEEKEEEEEAKLAQKAKDESDHNWLNATFEKCVSLGESVGTIQDGTTFAEWSEIDDESFHLLLQGKLDKEVEIESKVYGRIDEIPIDDDDDDDDDDEALHRVRPVRNRRSRYSEQARNEAGDGYECDDEEYDEEDDELDDETENYDEKHDEYGSEELQPLSPSIITSQQLQIRHEETLEPMTKDKPILVIDWTKVSRSRLHRGEKSYENEMMLQMLMKDFETTWETRLEEWFENGYAYHTTELKSARFIAMLDSKYIGPKRPIISKFGYPSICEGRPVKQCFQVVRRPTPWLPLNELKLAIDDCHRLPTWKSDMAEELENLAYIMEEQKKMKMTEPDAGPSTDKDNDERAPVLSKESDSREGDEHLQLIDQVIAMILVRSEYVSPSLPLMKYAKQQHVYLRNLWMKQFPPSI